MKIYFLLWRCIWADLEFLLAKKETKEIIIADVKRHQAKYLNKNVSFLYALNCSLIMVRSFRSIYSFRLRSEGNKLIKILLLLDEIFLPRCSSIEITGGIYGGGLTIAHNNCVIHVDRAGENLSIGPGVVIGKKGDKRPIIGDNVVINGNSSVIGGIVVGDNVIIGAGSVVVKDIPDNYVVAGNPSRIIRHMSEDSNDKNKE